MLTSTLPIGITSTLPIGVMRKGFWEPLLNNSIKNGL